MVNCEHCVEPVIMPYTCSLCGKKHCGKHRLPESHQCVNIGVFDTEEYRRQKLQKTQEARIMTMADFSSNDKQANMRFFGNQKFWSSGSINKDAFYGGMILGLVGVLELFSLSGPFNIFQMVLILLFGGSGFFLVQLVRNQSGKNFGVTSRFWIWPIGIAITLIISLIFIGFLLFGFFVNENRGSLKGESRVGLFSIYTFIGLFLISRILSTYIIAGGNVIIIPLIIIARLFLVYAVILILPFGDFDGVKIYNHNRGLFWLTLAVLIIFILTDIQIIVAIFG